MDAPARTPDGRLLDVPEGASPEEIEASTARRDRMDAENLAILRALHALGNQWPRD